MKKKKRRIVDRARLIGRKDKRPQTRQGRGTVQEERENEKK